MKKLLLFLAIFHICVLFTFSQENDSIRSENTENNYQNQTKDSYEAIITYQEILEKTNNQLSLWYNPYGLFVAIIGVLFAVLAIFTVFIVYRQGKEYKSLISESIENHNNTLNELIAEKERYLENYQISLDNSIKEYKQKLEDLADKNSKEQIESFINNLEKQKESLISQSYTYSHYGYSHKDIPINVRITPKSLFVATIKPNTSNQHFTIYLKVITSNGKQVWLGFAGNAGTTTPYVTWNEYTKKDDYNTDIINISENIYELFNTAFAKMKTNPITIEAVRLRGAKNDPNPVTFNFSFKNVL